MQLGKRDEVKGWKINKKIPRGVGKDEEILLIWNQSLKDHFSLKHRLFMDFHAFYSHFKFHIEAQILDFLTTNLKHKGISEYYS